MPKLVEPKLAVDTGSMTIHELTGNFATSNDKLSIGIVKVTKPTNECWLTIGYDEWLYILKGRVIIESNQGEIEVTAGQTVLIEKGTQFRPVFPEMGTEFIPICCPAFSPELVTRDESVNPPFAVNDGLTFTALPNSSSATSSSALDSSDIIYHMCQKESWEAAVQQGGAYYPKTFTKDGYFTPATAVPLRLVDTANHFYQDVPNEWICLRISRAALLHRGIIVRDEEPLKVGDAAVGTAWNTWICPHIYGGIPTVGVVDKIFPMSREGKVFTGIVGLDT